MSGKCSYCHKPLPDNQKAGFCNKECYENFKKYGALLEAEVESTKDEKETISETVQPSMRHCSYCHRLLPEGQKAGFCNKKHYDLFKQNGPRPMPKSRRFYFEEEPASFIEKIIKQLSVSHWMYIVFAVISLGLISYTIVRNYHKALPQQSVFFDNPTNRKFKVESLGLSFSIPPYQTVYAKLPAGKREIHLTNTASGEKTTKSIIFENKSQYVFSLDANSCYTFVDYNETFAMNGKQRLREPVWRHQEFFAPGDKIQGEYIVLFNVKDYPLPARELLPQTPFVSKVVRVPCDYVKGGKATPEIVTETPPAQTFAPTTAPESENQ